MEVKHRINIYIKSQGAEAVPPLGTVIGNLGVNTVNFCKEFNAFTADLPNYFLLTVEILIYANRSFTFTVKEPALGSIIGLLSNNNEKISVKSIIELALWKFPKRPLEESLPIILGKIKAANIPI